MLKQSHTSRQRGETLIELLLAFAILSLALVTVMRTMNGGLESISVNGQRSQTEALMRGQLAILQAAHQQAVKNPSAADWAEITGQIATTTAFSRQAVNPGACTYTSNKNRLYFPTASNASWTSEVGTRSGGSITPSFGVPLPDGTSMWMEAQHTPKDEATFSRGYYDFYIKSCWQGGGGVRQEAKMVTRLYDIEATTATPVYNNLVLTAFDTNCFTSGSPGKISYTIKNDNSYPFGQIRITINSNLENTHPNLAPGQTITNITSAGFSAGNYTVRATVVDTGDYKEVPVSILPCPPPPVTQFSRNGNDDFSCTPYGWYGCMEEATYLWNCQPFRVAYQAQTVMESGAANTYKFRISYGNYTGGPCGGWPSQAEYGAYPVRLFINGSLCTTYSLPNVGVDTEREFTIPCAVNNFSATQGPRIALEWLDDWYSTSGTGTDANLRINWVRVFK